MYAIYKQSNDDFEPKMVGACYTKLGAKRACRHFFYIYGKETNNSYCHVEYREVDDYWMLKFGYALLCIYRAFEKRKLKRLEANEANARSMRIEQERRLSSLY